MGAEVNDVVDHVLGERWAVEYREVARMLDMCAMGCRPLKVPGGLEGGGAADHEGGAGGDTGHSLSGDDVLALCESFDVDCDGRLTKAEIFELLDAVEALDLPDADTLARGFKRTMLQTAHRALASRPLSAKAAYLAALNVTRTTVEAAYAPHDTEHITSAVVPAAAPCVFPQDAADADVLEWFETGFPAMDALVARANPKGLAMRDLVRGFAMAFATTEALEPTLEYGPRRAEVACGGSEAMEGSDDGGEIADVDTTAGATAEEANKRKKGVLLLVDKSRRGAGPGDTGTEGGDEDHEEEFEEWEEWVEEASQSPSDASAGSDAGGDDGAPATGDGDGDGDGTGKSTRTLRRRIVRKPITARGRAPAPKSKSLMDFEALKGRPVQVYTTNLGSGSQASSPRRAVAAPPAPLEPVVLFERESMLMTAKHPDPPPSPPPKPAAPKKYAPRKKPPPAVMLYERPERTLYQLKAATADAGVLTDGAWVEEEVPALPVVMFGDPPPETVDTGVMTDCAGVMDFHTSATDGDAAASAPASPSGRVLVRNGVRTGGAVRGDSDGVSSGMRLMLPRTGATAAASTAALPVLPLATPPRGEAERSLLRAKDPAYIIANFYIRSRRGVVFETLEGRDLLPEPLLGRVKALLNVRMRLYAGMTAVRAAVRMRRVAAAYTRADAFYDAPSAGAPKQKGGAKRAPASAVAASPPPLPAPPTPLPKREPPPPTPVPRSKTPPTAVADKHLLEEWDAWKAEVEHFMCLVSENLLGHDLSGGLGGGAPGGGSFNSVATAAGSTAGPPALRVTPEIAQALATLTTRVRGERRLRAHRASLDDAKRRSGGSTASAASPRAGGPLTMVRSTPTSARGAARSGGGGSYHPHVSPTRAVEHRMRSPERPPAARIAYSGYQSIGDRYADAHGDPRRVSPAVGERGAPQRGPGQGAFVRVATLSPTRGSPMEGRAADAAMAGARAQMLPRRTTRAK